MEECTYELLIFLPTSVILCYKINIFEMKYYILILRDLVAKDIEEYEYSIDNKSNNYYFNKFLADMKVGTLFRYASMLWSKWWNY